ncbi:tryptophan synthase subunit alpha [Nocardioides jejuensis]|uniref:Tryptophan synthase alpha chain n=1 Tax=Nocardioides jejuensis TaxID=2502782 RepID=A0A4V2NY37_9ACTN|nr:tryptophan synthase subunit alpha [Nocardioides jejuensis]TCJ23622.1 tryptophan synthase subunit alpha [Nocardioides jejuensis]
MTTTATAFARAKAEGRAALVGYLPAGFPDLDGSIEALKVMVEHGCDVIEIGLPYTDPVMDGPIIQAAAQQALDNGTRTKQVLQAVEAVAKAGAPTLVMTYWGPIERYGVEQFAADLANAGGAGLITPDITPDFGQEWIAAADAHDLDKVFLVAPSSTPARIAMTTAASRGFVYATGVMGVTGGKQATGDIVRPLIERTKATTDLPVGVGVGVSTGAQAAQFAQYADGVIVGSAFVRTLLEAPDRATGLRNLAALTEELAAGVRGRG